MSLSQLNVKAFQVAETGSGSGVGGAGDGEQNSILVAGRRCKGHPEIHPQMIRRRQVAVK